MKYFSHTFSWEQGSWLTAGIILLCSSFLALSPMADNLVAISHWFGLSMLLAGCANILVSCKRGNALHGSKWIFADGLSTALLSFFLLFNQMILPAMIPFFFGVWELFSGILKVIDAEELRNEKVRKWQWCMVIGSAELLSGVAALLKPVEEFMGMNVVIFAVLLIQSFSYVLKACNYSDLIIRDKRILLETNNFS